MMPIPKTFFITGLGRSGTKYLASVLDRSEEYRVIHEWRIPRTPFYDGNLTRFPLWRFYLARHPLGEFRKGYGEVNSYLRLTLDPERVGPERHIAKRGIILRDPRDIVSSAMNRRGRAEGDFHDQCEDKVRRFATLLRVLNDSHLHYERFEFRRFTSDPAYVQQIAEWAGIEGLEIPVEVVERKVNTSERSSFPQWRSWSADQERTFFSIAERYGVAEEVEALEAPSPD